MRVLTFQFFYVTNQNAQGLIFTGWTAAIKALLPKFFRFDYDLVAPRVTRGASYLNGTLQVGLLITIRVYYNSSKYPDLTNFINPDFFQLFKDQQALTNLFTAVAPSAASVGTLTPVTLGMTNVPFKPKLEQEDTKVSSDAQPSLNGQPTFQNPSTGTTNGQQSVNGTRTYSTFALPLPKPFGLCDICHQRPEVFAPLAKRVVANVGGLASTNA